MDNPNNHRKPRGRPRGWADTSEENTLKSLDRALEIFEYLSAHSGQTLSALAKELGQAPATVYRVLLTLEKRRLAEFTPDDQRWHIGSNAYVVGARYLRRTSLVERARPIMRRLMEASGETANLGIVQDFSVLFVSQVETHASIRAFFPPGTVSPLHASGIGKALLAEMPRERLDRVIAKNGLASFTAKSLTTRQALMADLERTRARGHAIDDEERTDGMRCVAAAIFDVHEEAAAGISVSGPITRMSADKTAEFAAAVMDAALELTAAIGGARPTRPQP
ncbi:HTH-type transcriptional regulator BhcR [Fulvimarina sp. MAC3]|uniref:HTH-type transcriptional regulator BhcR n=1 Tax=Fulvimarina sp. MAC3 TaxID=3148887 RepID=UPI0031FBBED3